MSASRTIREENVCEAFSDVWFTKAPDEFSKINRKIVLKTLLTRDSNLNNDSGGNLDILGGNTNASIGNDQQRVSLLDL